MNKMYVQKIEIIAQTFSRRKFEILPPSGCPPLVN